MNILGEGFPDQIVKQVEVRQKVYGSGYNSLNPRTPEEIIYLNANTSWVKLASSVNVDNPKIIQNSSLAGEDIKGNKLAKKFVLFNGVNEDPSNQRSGIALNQDLLGNNNAYGIGGTEFGLRPMMGIISADIKHENRGSIRRATIKVKAFNKVQFDIIDVLYLRLGFNVLLEWGHSMYFDNDEVLQKGSDNDNSLVSKFLDPSGTPIFTPGPQGNVIGGTTSTTTSLTYVDFLKLIDEQRRKSNGNYDAMFGKVCNFHWSFLPDGSYDITIDLVSIGDIIESFKINALIDGIDISAKAVKKDDKDPSQMTSTDVIALYYNQSKIGQYFYELTDIKNLENKTTDSFGLNLRLNELRNSLRYAKALQNNDRIATLEAEILNILKNPSSGNSDVINITYTGEGGATGDTTYYIRLGAFLDFVEKKLMYHFDVNGTTVPALKFDTEVETNLMYIEPLQVSTDPTVCVVRRKMLMSTVNDSIFEVGVGDGGLGEEFESPLFQDQPNPYGQIMNIYVSMKFILLKLDELKNADTNKVVLIDFLNNILSAINSSLGGISKLETTINETTVIIRDGNPLPNIQEVIKVLNNNQKTYKIYDKYAQFDLYGYSTTNPSNSTTDIYGGKGHASFIKDFSFTTEISPGLSTILTVGATANSTVVGENSTAFSKFNAGLTDRYKEKIVYLKDDGTPDTEIIAYAPPEYSTPEARTKTREIEEQTLLYKELYLKYASTYSNYCDYVFRLSKKIYNGEADTYKDALNNFITFKQQADFTLWASLAKKEPTKYAIPAKFAPSTGFIPFNMSLTMDGLSGMKIYSKFNIDIAYLPSNYPDNADFLIKNINHTISNNKWFTKIESVVISQSGGK